MKKWLKIDDGVIFLRYICRKGCIINQKGLKFGRKKQYLLGILCMFAVTSFAEVWIEIPVCSELPLHLPVTSFAEVWIEIFTSSSSMGNVNRHFLRGSVD